MKLSKAICRWLAVGTVLFSILQAAPADFYAARLPAGVAFGMTPEQLEDARKTVDRRDFGSTASDRAGNSQAFEMRRQQDSALAFSYRFKGGKLGAIIGSTKTTMLPIEHTQSAASNIGRELIDNFTLKGEDQIVRSVATVASVLTAQLWDDKERGLNLYFVATNHEITLVIFDPKAFGKADFFNGVELLEKVKANNESIRRTLGNSAPPPVAIVDFLAKPTVKPGDTLPPAIPPVSPRPADSETKAQSKPSASPLADSTAFQEKPVAVWPWIAGGVLALAIILLVVCRGRERRDEKK